MSQKEQHNEIQVTVTFPLAGAPFHGDFSPQATAGQVRSAAMTKFNATEDPSSVFYLTHNAERLADDRTLGEIADNAKSLKLRLVKELVQG